MHVVIAQWEQWHPQFLTSLIILANDDWFELGEVQVCKCELWVLLCFCCKCGGMEFSFCGTHCSLCQHFGLAHNSTANKECGMNNCQFVFWFDIGACSIDSAVNHGIIWLSWKSWQLFWQQHWGFIEVAGQQTGCVHT